MKIAFLGDIALIGKYNIEENKDAKNKLSSLSNKLKEYDLVIGNLETPLTEKKRTLVCKSMHLRAPMSNAELLKYLNVNAVSLANNHIYDFGRTGLSDTLKVLDECGIEWFGVNNKYLIREIDGEKISLSGFACYSTNGSGYGGIRTKRGVNPLIYEVLDKQLEIDRKNDAFSIMSFHWGDEHTNYPKVEHIKLAEKLIASKDLIIHGHHPHVIQGVQKFHNSVVAYSLGNFIFDDCISLNRKLILKQNEQNKRAFIMEIEIQEGVIAKTSYIGLAEKNDGFEFFDIDKEIDEISNKLDKIKSVEEYNDLRRTQINQIRNEKFGKRNISWLMKRINYYSIGAKLGDIIRKRKYTKISKKFK